jgi:hypothetical protein
VFETSRVIYTKGKAAPLGETTVRATMRERRAG